MGVGNLYPRLCPIAYPLFPIPYPPAPDQIWIVVLVLGNQQEMTIRRQRCMNGFGKLGQQRRCAAW